MNEKAAELGLQRTHFARPDGLDAPGHYSTAADVTRLAEAAMRIPRIREVVRLRTDSIAGGRQLHTWNDLLGVFRGLYGVKTGHTAAAGWCEVAAVRRNGVTLYTTVLGSPSRSQRNADLASLLRWGISRYRPMWVVEPRRVYLSAAVGYGKPKVPLVPAKGASRAVRVDRPLVERVTAPATLSLPVSRGDTVGEVRVYSGKRLVARRALVAARSVSRPGLGGRVGFYAGRTLSHIGDWVT
jgi:D-alanyl-D-alanine carboxypeptidase